MSMILFLLKKKIEFFNLNVNTLLWINHSHIIDIEFIFEKIRIFHYSILLNLIVLKDKVRSPANS